MRARFAVDFDGTLIEDDHYPLMGPWIPGAVEALRKLQRIGDVVIYTCRTASDDWVTGEPRTSAEVEHDLAQIETMLFQAGLGDIEVWTKPYKPPAAVYIDNRAVRFSGNWGATMQHVFDALTGTAGTTHYPKPGDIGVDGRRVPEPGRMIQFDAEQPVDWYVLGDDPFPTLAAEGPRHPGSQRFHELLELAGEMHDRKQIDYGKDNDPFANVRSSTEWGIPGWVGAMVRLNDKVRRLQSLRLRGSLANESALDSFMDIAVYALIAYVLYEQEMAEGGAS